MWKIYFSTYEENGRFPFILIINLKIQEIQIVSYKISYGEKIKFFSDFFYHSKNEINLVGISCFLYI